MRKAYLNKIDNPEREMGRPRFIDPLIGAALIGGGATILSGLIGSSATSSANKQNAENAKTANAITNQQWGAEMKVNKEQFSQKMQYQEMKDFNDMLTRYPALQKNLIDIWGGGK